MLGKNELLSTPLGKGLLALAEAMDEMQMPSLSLNVIGGFAMILHGNRDKNTITDVDYVGEDLSKELAELVNDIGERHGLGEGWINKDVMCSGLSLDDFEFATDKLHFDHCLDVGRIQINVLQEPDILRMKILAIDTNLMALPNGADFTRGKDLPDIKILVEKLSLTEEDIQRKFGKYCEMPDTLSLIQTYVRHGEQEFMTRLAEKYPIRLKERLMAQRVEHGKQRAREQKGAGSELISAIVEQAIAMAKQESSEGRKNLENGIRKLVEKLGSSNAANDKSENPEK